MAEEFVPCAFCTGPVERNLGPRCTSCGVYLHVACWNDFGGCTTYGCENSEDMIKFQGENNGS